LAWVIEQFGAAYELARLGAISRFRFKGAYWQWRYETAFGRGEPETRAALVASLWHYARWVYRMRRGRG